MIGGDGKIGEIETLFWGRILGGFFWVKRVGKILF